MARSLNSHDEDELRAARRIVGRHGEIDLARSVPSLDG